ncbi:signal peptide, CUB and EGF-like domain-containing protein 1 [Physella acuta]|uniref:signal peptide, CUB and EGF-like domain-containing protein 1 n=1 Tax=Physella acuta TaxID=109671 RepID=UPI0027DC4AD3|nr:signal peptide, CUB and EGF-like domain-containing protein 1 [Physella acuta]
MTEGSFVCSCLSGYRLDAGNQRMCLDIDECLENSRICDSDVEICINTVGSYVCSCKKGFARNAYSICQDIDECKLKIDKCEQICDNNVGSYSCLCQQGLYLSDNRLSCVKATDPCINQSLNCSYGCSVDSDSKASCFCRRGYALKDKFKCEDINECLSNGDNFCYNKTSCDNTDGSYTCSCPAGSKLDNDARSCIGCRGETWGLECNNSCRCGPGADHCDVVTGCVCKSGFTGTYCTADIDECSNGVLKCGGNEVCVNLLGSAKCECVSGFTREDGECQDFNECSNVANNSCQQLCTNVVGSYTCSCFQGYWYNTTTNACLDVDECQLGKSGCQQTCVNTDGGYSCSCKTGMRLLPDGRGCVLAIETQKIKITFNLDASRLTLEDKLSNDYYKTKLMLESELYRALKSTGLAVINVTVLNLSKGSLIADLEISFDAGDSKDNTLDHALKQLMAGGLVINNSTVTFVYATNYNIGVQQNLGIEVGVSVSVTVVVAVKVGLFVRWCKKRKKSS